MTTTEAIMRHLQSLPDSAQKEVLDFVEFLRSRSGQTAAGEEDRDWSDFSLTSAMRGMEGEQTQYTEADLKEVFK